MKAGLDREKIIQKAAEMADENGFASVTLKSLAEELGIKPPSLYKHFKGGLDELHEELMLYSCRCLDAAATKATIGKAKDDAIAAYCYAFRDFATGHRGLYEAMQWYNMYQSEAHLEATESIIGILFQVLDAYHLEEEKKVHIVRTLRAFVHGFASIECNDGYGNPMPVDETFDFALKIILNGIRDC